MVRLPERTLLLRRLLNLDGLEAALQRCVFLNVLAVLNDRRRADALQLASREARLEQVCRIDRALSSPSSHERMELVDEQDRIVRSSHLLDHISKPLLELATVLGICDQ